MSRYSIVINKSTVPVSATDKVRQEIETTLRLRDRPP